MMKRKQIILIVEIILIVSLIITKIVITNKLEHDKIKVEIKERNINSNWSNLNN